MPIAEVEPGRFVIEVGGFDTDDGIHIFVADEAFPRLSVTAAGVATGDGSVAPFTAPSAPDPADFADGDYLMLVTVTNGVAVTDFVDAADYVNP
jgi:hypothetical protein